MNGPNPVWIFATNKLNQSKARPAPGDVGGGRGAGEGVVSPTDGGPPVAGAGVEAAGCTNFAVFCIGSIGRCRPRRGRCLRAHESQWPRGALVLRRFLQLALGDIQHHGRIRVSRIEFEQRPIDGDSPVAHAQEAAEFDDGDAHPALRIREHIDDAAEIVAILPAHLAAQ
jgi:hypothetical protein